MRSVKSSRDAFDIEEVRSSYKKELRRRELFRMFQTIREAVKEISSTEKQSADVRRQKPKPQPIQQSFFLNQDLAQLCSYHNQKNYSPPIIQQQYQGQALQLQHKQQSDVYFQRQGVIVYKRLLGSGTYSQVWEGKLKATGQKIAAKQVKKLEPNEVKCLTELSSSNIIKVIDVFTHLNKSFVILEHCDKNLRDQLQNCNFDFQSVLKYFEQILHGIDALQDRNIIHRDLKFQNILLKDQTIKIADFGLAKFLENELQVQSRVCGTPYTMAPQIYFSTSKKAPYSIKSDIWSIGVILHEMLYRCHPFNSDKHDFKFKKRLRLNKRFGILDQIIDKCLVFKPSTRISMSELKELFAHYLQSRQGTKVQEKYFQEQKENVSYSQPIMRKKGNFELQEPVASPIKNRKQSHQIKAEINFAQSKNKKQQKFVLQHLKQVESIIYEASVGEQNVQPQKVYQGKPIIEAKKIELKPKTRSRSFMNEIIIIILAVVSGLYLLVD